MVGFIFVGIFLIVVLIIILKGKGQSGNHSSDAFTPNAAMNDTSAMDSIVMQENGTHSTSCDDFTGNDVSDSSSFDSGCSDSAGGCD